MDSARTTGRRLLGRHGTARRSDRELLLMRSDRVPKQGSTLTGDRCLLEGPFLAGRMFCLPDGSCRERAGGLGVWVFTLLKPYTL